MRWVSGTPGAREWGSGTQRSHGIAAVHQGLTCVAEHGDLGVVLDVVHEGVAPAGDDQVDDVIQFEEVRDGVARRHEAHEVGAHARGER